MRHRQQNQYQESSMNNTIDSNCVEFPNNFTLSSKNNKSNFVDDMRKRLNLYNIEKIKMLEHKRQKQEWYQQQIKAKNALMQADQSSLMELQSAIDANSFRPKNQQITGWNYENLKQLKTKKNKRLISSNSQQQRDKLGGQQSENNMFEESIKLVSARIMGTKCMNMHQTQGTSLDAQKRKQSGIVCLQNTKNPNMIIYLKTLLNRLESPNRKRQLKTQNRPRISSQNNNPKLKTQQTVAKIRKSKLSLNKINKPGQVPVQRQKILVANRNMQTLLICKNQQPQQTQKVVTKKHIQRAKFQIPSIAQLQNRPFTIQQAQQTTKWINNRDYQKIKRKSVAQYQIDITHQKDILQQLIRGSSSTNRVSNPATTYYSQRNNYGTATTKQTAAAEKFTLKNLLY